MVSFVSADLHVFAEAQLLPLLDHEDPAVKLKADSGVSRSVSMSGSRC